MEARVKSSRLIRDSEIAIELLELTAQSGEVVRERRGIGDSVVGAKETVEGCFDERRFCGTGMFGRFCQPRSHAFGEINANSGFHERDLPCERLVLASGFRDSTLLAGAMTR